MSAPKDSERSFQEFLDCNLLETTFKPGTTAYEVERSLVALINNRLENFRSVYAADAVYETVVHTISSVMRVWYPMDLTAGSSLSRFDLGYTAKLVTAPRFATDSLLNEDVLGCLTAPLTKVEGTHVSTQVVSEILQAAGKVYMVASQAIERANLVSNQIAQTSYNKVPRVVEGSCNTSEIPMRIHTLHPSHPDYDPLFPTFTRPSSGTKDLHPRVPKRTTPKQDDKSKARPLADTNQPKITSLFAKSVTSPSKILGNDPTSAHTITFVQPGTSSPMNTSQASAPPPTKPTGDPESLGSSSGSGSGNPTRSLPVPWLQDEEDYIKGLLVITRGQVSWQELAEAANEYFRDKPIIKNTGDVIPRGRRSRDSVRQNPAFRGYDKWWYRLDEEWKDVGGPTPIIDWTGFSAEIKAREGAQEDGFGATGQFVKSA